MSYWNSSQKKKFDASRFNKGQIANHNQDAIYGYVRLNYSQHVHTKHAMYLFPVDIIKLIIFFYQDGINWHFSKDELNWFKTAHTKWHAVHSADIKINEVVFHYVVYPRYFEHDYEASRTNGEIRFGLDVRAMPDNIEYMKVYFELYCVETNNSFRSTSTFGTYQHSGSVLEVMKTNSIDDFLLIHNGLTLQGCMDILCIKYREENTRLNHDPRFMDLTRLDMHSRMSWNIEKETVIAKLQGHTATNPNTRYVDMFNTNVSASEKWRIYSPANFNHNAFGLCLSNCQNVNGMSIMSQNTVLLSVRMFRIPAKVKQLDVWCRCTVAQKRYKRKCLMKNGGEQSFTFCKFKPREISNVIKSLQDVAVQVEVEIVAVFDYNDHVVEPKKWKEYGILV